MTQPYQYDPSQQPGQPTPPFDPAQQPGQPYDPAQQQPGQPFDPSQQPPGPDSAATQPPSIFDSGQAAAPFGPPPNEPPGFGPPGNFLPPPEPKKSKGGMFIVLSIVVVLLIGGGIGVAIWRPWAPASGTTDDAKSSEAAEDDKKDKDESSDEPGDDDEGSDEGVPSQVVDDAWHAATWDEAKGYMCESLVTELEDNGAADKYKPIGPDEEFKTTSEEIKEDKATVGVETTVKSPEGQPEVGKLEVGLVKEESDWKICEINNQA